MFESWLCSVMGVRGSVCGFFGFRSCLQLRARDVQMSEYLGELPRGWCLTSLCASKFEKMFAWCRSLCSVVFGWMVVLLVCALSMMSLVMLVRMMRG